ncbi:MAG: histone deacetylase [Spirochaetaceae bacterium]|nr:MAG: histone deacetylase [Spirochaetaceae bacterium]
MILHDRTPKLSIAAYGIEIPITGSNANRTLEYLLDQPDLAARKEEWLREEHFPPLTREAILRVHDPAYVERLLAEDERADREIERTFELVNPDGTYNRYDPARAERNLRALREQSLRLAAGTSRAAELAVTGPERFWFYFGGGMHHGQYDFGGGFCPVNDLVIAIRTQQAAGRIGNAWIVDVDAHKGDGTAALTREDETIRTLSVHMAAGWPLDQPERLPDGRPNPSFVPSDVDIPISPGEEAQYVPRLAAAMEEMEKRFGIPDFLLVVDGSDPYERDQLPSTQLLRMTREQLLERDILLYKWAARHSLPTTFVMAGNYGYHSWEVYAGFLERQLRGQLDTL